MTTIHQRGADVARGVQSPNPSMTVDDAIQIYANFGDDLEGFYVDVYNQLIASKPSVEIPNSNYLHALQLTALMLRNAQTDFCMLAGGNTDCFAKTLEAEFRKMLTRFTNAGRKSIARIVIVNPSNEMPTLLKLCAEFPDSLQIIRARATEEERVRHYIVADDMVREEEPHKRLTLESRADEIKAKVVFNNKSRADLFRSQFTSLVGMLTA